MTAAEAAQWAVVMVRANPAWALLTEGALLLAGLVVACSAVADVARAIGGRR